MTNGKLKRVRSKNPRQRAAKIAGQYKARKEEKPVEQAAPNGTRYYFDGSKFQPTEPDIEPDTKPAPYPFDDLPEKDSTGINWGVAITVGAFIGLIFWTMFS